MENYTFGELLNKQIKEINYDVEVLSSGSIKNKWEILKDLKQKVAVLSSLISVLNTDYIFEVKAIQKLSQNVKVQQEIPLNDDLPTFTGEELSKYDGRNGNPGYVAVNGLVYDVTENRSWLRGRHFGLPCGKALTLEYIQCHEGNDILSKLKVVGRLV